MSDDILETYPHAMVMDSETGKPMMKVQAQGGTSGGGEISFPEDFPDSESISKLEDVKNNTSGLSGKLDTMISLLQDVNSKLDDITSGGVTFKVNVVEDKEPEPEPEPEEPEEEEEE